MTAAVIPGHVRCRYCSRFCHPVEFIGDPIVGFCLRCYHRHTTALDALTQSLPAECPNCHRTYEQLQEQAALGDNTVTMSLFVMDGVLALLCRPCGDLYEQKRRDFFGNTPYGAAKNITTT